MKKYKYVLGIGLNLFDARAILLRDDGKVVLRIEKKRQDVNANETIEVVLSLCEDILAKSKKFKDDICGIGLALGGIVDKKKGIIYWPQKVDSSCVYISVPLKKYLEERFKLLVFIENDSNACVVAEHNSNYKKYKHLLYMFSGVGCGMVLNGSLYRGRDGGAGEIFVKPQAIMSSSLGEFSFLSQWPADLGVVKRAKELMSFGKDSSLIKKITSTGDISMEDIFNEANNKDKISKDILREAAFSLGIKVAFFVNLMNPEVIIIGGGFEEAGDFFLDEVSKTVKKFSFDEMRSNIKIVFSKLGREATSLGAGSLVFEEISLQE